tara:strand:+ start:216 stop:485 length:270 start_codon:yes stop_codon:yes gene_type:complete
MNKLVTESDERPKCYFSDGSLPLQEIQKKVGGYIRIVTLSDNRKMAVNDDGLLMNLPYNKEATELAQPSMSPDDYIVGDVVVFSKGAFR